MIHMVEWKGPDPAMFNIVQELKGFASEMSNDSEAMSGNGTKQRTATEAKIETTLAIAEYAVIVRRFLFSLDYEIKALARLNSVYLDDANPFEFATADKLGEVKVYQVTRRDYLNDLDIEFTAEARMASTPQRIEEAQSVLETVVELAALPPGLINPMAMPGLVYASLRSLFEAQNRFDLVKALGPPPPPVGMMPGMAGPPVPGMGPPGMTPPPAMGGAPNSTALNLPPAGQPMNETEKVADVVASGVGAVQ